GRRFDKIVEALGLAVARNRGPAGQLAQVNAMAAPSKTQLEAVMNESLAPHPLPDARFVEDVHRALFQHARPDAAFDILAAAGFDDNGFNALQPQQAPKQQSSRACSDNPDLCSHGCSSEKSGQWAVGGGQ